MAVAEGTARAPVVLALAPVLAPVLALALVVVAPRPPANTGGAAAAAVVAAVGVEPGLFGSRRHSATRFVL